MIMLGVQIWLTTKYENVSGVRNSPEAAGWGGGVRRACERMPECVFAWHQTQYPVQKKMNGTELLTPPPRSGKLVAVDSAGKRGQANFSCDQLGESTRRGQLPRQAKTVEPKANIRTRDRLPSMPTRGVQDGG